MQKKLKVSQLPKFKESSDITPDNKDEIPICRVVWQDAARNRAWTHVDQIDTRPYMVENFGRCCVIGDSIFCLESFTSTGYCDFHQIPKGMVKDITRLGS